MFYLNLKFFRSNVGNGVTPDSVTYEDQNDYRIGIDLLDKVVSCRQGDSSLYPADSVFVIVNSALSPRCG